jgi:hypothetical protein
MVLQEFRMTDLSQGVADLYQSLSSIFDDLNRVGRDCGQALNEVGFEFQKFEEYSHSPNALTLKKSHAWLYSREEDVAADGKARRVVFFSLFAYFAPDPKRWKVGKPGVPELWFFVGSVSPPENGNLAYWIQTFFDKGDEQSFKPPAALGGTISEYNYMAQQHTWKAVLSGWDLAAIDSASALKEKAIKPLVAAAQSAKI